MRTNRTVRTSRESLDQEDKQIKMKLDKKFIDTEYLLVVAGANQMQPASSRLPALVRG